MSGWVAKMRRKTKSFFRSAKAMRASYRCGGWDARWGGAGEAGCTAGSADLDGVQPALGA
jgi:hypothetical protein